MTVPDVPATFTKFPASLAGRYDDIEITGDATDWEADLVAVIGRHADHVAEASAWGTSPASPSARTSLRDQQELGGRA